MQTKQEFLLLTRDRSDGWMFHHLLLLHFQGNVAVRDMTFSLMVPEHRLEILEE